MSPLLLACSTGASNVVQLLCQWNANIYKRNQKGQGALQLAREVAGDNQILQGWLRKEYPDLEMTTVPARGEEDQRRGRGQFGAEYRHATGPFSETGRDKGRGKDRSSRERTTGHPPHYHWHEPHNRWHEPDNHCWEAYDQTSPWRRRGDVRRQQQREWEPPPWRRSRSREPQRDYRL